MTGRNPEAASNPGHSDVISPATRRLARNAFVFLIAVVVLDLVLIAGAIMVQHAIADRQARAEQHSSL